MIDKELVLPKYAKITILLIGFIALFAVLFIAKSIIAPLIFSIIIAILLNPVVNLFVRIRINRVIAIVIALSLTLIIILTFGTLIISQVSSFSESWPILVVKLTALLNDAISWFSGYFDINPIKIHEWIEKTKGELINASSAVIGQTLSSLGDGLMMVFLIPVYIFLLLYYQPLILDFIHKLFGENHQGKVKEIVTKTKSVIQLYLIGLVIEFVMVAILNTIVLLILGIEYVSC